MNLLIVDNEASMRDGLKQALKLHGYQVLTASNSHEAIHMVKLGEIDIAFIDLKMPNEDGISLIKKLNQLPNTPEMILMSGYGRKEDIVEVMRLGVDDFLQKPFLISDILKSIERTRKYVILKEKLSASLAKFNTSQDQFGSLFEYPIIGQSNAIRNVIGLIKKVASTPDTSVMITGESGVGKENVARGIHKLSSRCNELFGAVNSSAITDSLFESEFFGYKRGAFTGAYENKPGWFEVCDGGTLFLDEITDLTPGNQAKLLRTLEDKTITRIGTNKSIVIDIRIISATNQTIEKMVNEKKFRSDLFHRLNTFCIHIPPLRERLEDIPLLFEYFFRTLTKKLNSSITGYNQAVITHLQHYSFPGNIRELKNLVERAIILCDSDKLQLKDIMPGSGGHPESRIIKDLDLDAVEKEAIIRALEISGGKRNKTSQLLNITPQSLDRRLEKHAISFVFKR